MKDPLPIIETKVKLASRDDMITLLARKSFWGHFVNIDTNPSRKHFFITEMQI